MHPPQSPEYCPLCDRPKLRPSDHHLIPRTRGGTETESICEDCHKAIHAQFSNKQLEKEFNTVAALLSNERFRRTVNFISKQDPSRRVRTVRSKDQRRRGRNG